MTELNGHCLCGTVTWEADQPPIKNLICHCESCRRHASAPFAAFVGFQEDQVRWTGSAPAIYHSTPEASRGFCATCGSSLFFKSTRWPGELHLFAATLADHSTYQGTEHVVWEEHVDWADIHGDGLPRTTSFSTKPEE